MKIRPNEPSIDPQRHLSLTELQRVGSQITPERSGVLHCIVQRQEDGSRVQPKVGSLCQDNGLVSDRWSLDPKRKKEEQIAIMDWKIAVLIANGQPLTLFGDNLFIDWNFAQIPVGTRFALGDAVLEITPEPHTGCAKFAKRFGTDALAYTCCIPENHVRGVYAHVIVSGDIKIGDQLVSL